MVPIMPEDEFRKVAEAFGGVDALREGSRQFKANVEYQEAHSHELKRRYPDQWVGILRQEVRAVGDTPREVMDSLREAGEDLTGVHLHKAWVEEPVLIL